jgi:hypothetical protein
MIDTLFLTGTDTYGNMTKFMALLYLQRIDKINSAMVFQGWLDNGVVYPATVCLRVASKAKW